MRENGPMFQAWIALLPAMVLLRRLNSKSWLSVVSQWGQQPKAARAENVEGAG
jgi:hypothetical protein